MPTIAELCDLTGDVEEIRNQFLSRANEIRQAANIKYDLKEMIALCMIIAKCIAAKIKNDSNPQVELAEGIERLVPFIAVEACLFLDEMKTKGQLQ